MSQSDESELRHLVDELFLRTDAKDWPAAIALFVDTPFEVDMTSLIGGAPLQLTAAQLFAGFAQGLHAGKVSHHMASNYRIQVTGRTATIYAHGYAVNHVPSLPAGRNLWETWGTYRLDATRTPTGWRLAAFRYTSRFARGDDAVRTHQAT